MDSSHDAGTVSAALQSDPALPRLLTRSRDQLDDRCFTTIRDRSVEHPRLQPEFWSIQLPFAVEEDIATLPSDARRAVDELLLLPMTDPEVPEQGVELRGDLHGLRLARHGDLGLVYEVVPRTRLGRVVRILAVITVHDGATTAPRRSTVPGVAHPQAVAYPVLRKPYPLPRPVPTSDDVVRLARRIDPLLAGFAAQIEDAVVPGWRVVHAPSSVGRSRLGGLPDMLPTSQWPVDAEGASLTFLAQFDLADLPHPVERSCWTGGRALPERGLLQFFWDEESPGSAGLSVRLELVPRRQVGKQGWISGAGWQPRALPADLECLRSGHDSRWRYFPPHPVLLASTLTLPVDIGELRPDDDVDLDGQFDDLRAALGAGHQLLGAAYPAQGPVEDEADEHEAPDAGDWRLLLQLAFDAPFTAATDSRSAFGSHQAVYVLIREHDLHQRRFDRTTLVTQAL